jgi:N-formylglutamate amidohydrolase
MTDIFRFIPGDSPLLISVPHDGRVIPDAIRKRMTAAGEAIPDTDWHVAELYNFAEEIGASLLVANYSRYVIDLNRSADDAALYPGQVATGLCPEKSFSGDSIYQAGGVSAAEKVQRVLEFWRPYHEQIQTTLDACRGRHGHALLWDAHSIPSAVPRLFDGELPQLNLGSDSARSCATHIEQALAAVLADSDYSAVVNGRFKGGYITRHYGDPDNDVHALQLEIAQRTYMDEKTLRLDEDKAAALRVTLKAMLNRFQQAARK